MHTRFRLAGPSHHFKRKCSGRIPRRECAKNLPANPCGVGDCVACSRQTVRMFSLSGGAPVSTGRRKPITAGRGAAGLVKSGNKSNWQRLRLRLRRLIRRRRSPCGRLMGAGRGRCIQAWRRKVFPPDGARLQGELADGCPDRGRPLRQEDIPGLCP